MEIERMGKLIFAVIIGSIIGWLLGEFLYRVVLKNYFDKKMKKYQEKLRKPGGLK